MISYQCQGIFVSNNLGSYCFYTGFFVYWTEQADRPKRLVRSTGLPAVSKEEAHVWIYFLLTRLSQGVTVTRRWRCREEENFYSHASRKAWRYGEKFYTAMLAFLLTRLSQGVTATSCPSRYCITLNTRSGHKASILTPLYFTTIRQIFQRTFPLFSNHCTFAVTVQEISELFSFACPYHIIITPSGS